MTPQHHSPTLRSSAPRIKIYGAGSIGNHLAYAARCLGWSVTVSDISPEALRRMKEEIYPNRYGRWDPAIQLYHNRDVPSGGFDLIAIGTPPDAHLSLAFEALREQPKALLVEKPFCPPVLDSVQEFYRLAVDSSVQVFVGYNHVVGKAAQAMEALIRSGAIGHVQTIDVEFREHWGDIFKAHPWLGGPEESYLGFWQRGGGAGGEHSHGIHFWQHLAHLAGAGRVVEVEAMVRYATEGSAWYDDLCLIQMRTDGGLIGRVAQDVVTRPPRKRARIQGTEGVLEWVNHYNAEGDAVVSVSPGQFEKTQIIPKKRPDDFIEELKHVEAHWEHGTPPSPIRLERGLDTLLVVAAAHRSEAEGGRIQLDHRQGYTTEALRPVREAVGLSHEKEGVIRP